MNHWAQAGSVQISFDIGMTPLPFPSPLLEDFFIDRRTCVGGERHHLRIKKHRKYFESMSNARSSPDEDGRQMALSSPQSRFERVGIFPRTSWEEDRHVRISIDILLLSASLVRQGLSDKLRVAWTRLRQPVTDLRVLDVNSWGRKSDR